jgi:molecular chaperone DnaJ
VETPVKLTEHQRKLLKELDESFRKGGDRHSPNAKSWTDRVKDLFKSGARSFRHRAVHQRV